MAPRDKSTGQGFTFIAHTVRELWFLQAQLNANVLLGTSTAPYQNYHKV